MKVRAIKNFLDKGQLIKAGQVLVLPNDRAKTLFGKGVIEAYIEEAMLEEKTEKAVKRTRRKKNED